MSPGAEETLAEAAEAPMHDAPPEERLPVNSPLPVARSEAYVSKAREALTAVGAAEAMISAGATRATTQPVNAWAEFDAGATASSSSQQHGLPCWACPLIY